MNENIFSLNDHYQGNIGNVIMLPCSKLTDHPLRFKIFDELYIQELTFSIARYGLFSPLLVRLMDDGCYQVISGHCRLKAILKLKWAHCPVAVIDCDDITAKILLASSNSSSRYFTAIEEGLIIQSMHEQDNLEFADISKLFRKSNSWVSRRLSLVLNLEENVQNDVQKGLIKARTAQEIALLPQGNQTVFADCVKMHNLSKDETSELVQAIKKSDFNDEIFNACVNNPKGYLKNTQSNKQKKIAKDVVLKDNSIIVLVNNINTNIKQLVMSMEEKVGGLAKEETSALRKACSELNFNIVHFSNVYKKMFLNS